MHTPLLKALVLGLLIAALAACSDVSAPTATEEVKVTPISASEVDTSTFDQVTEDGAGGELEASQDTISRFIVQIGDASRRPFNGVCFYTDANFQGRAYCFEAGFFDIPVGFSAALSSIRASFNDTASSMLISPGYNVQLFNNVNLSGGGFGVSATANLSGIRNFTSIGGIGNFNDRLSSLKITKER